MGGTHLDWGGTHPDPSNPSAPTIKNMGNQTGIDLFVEQETDKARNTLGRVLNTQKRAYRTLASTVESTVEQNDLVPSPRAVMRAPPH